MNSNIREAVIDTDFFNKITQAPNIADGKDLFMRTMKDFNVRPVVHYYLANRELQVQNPIATELLNSKCLKVYTKEDIVTDSESVKLYEENFRKWYNYLNINKPRLEKNVDVFTLYRAGHSLGEIHSILMAYFMGLDIIMSDDSDARTLVYNAGLSNIKVFNLVDIYSDIAKKEIKSITLDEVKNIICSENSEDSIKLKRIKNNKFKKVRDVWVNAKNEV